MKLNRKVTYITAHNDESYTKETLPKHRPFAVKKPCECVKCSPHIYDIDYCLEVTIGEYFIDAHTRRVAAIFDEHDVERYIWRNLINYVSKKFEEILREEYERNF